MYQYMYLSINPSIHLSIHLPICCYLSIPINRKCRKYVTDRLENHASLAVILNQPASSVPQKKRTNPDITPSQILHETSWEPGD